MPSVRYLRAEVPQIYRAVVSLWLEGHDNMEIAALLGLNYNTVRSRLVRGKRSLLRVYQAALGEAEAG